MKSTELYDLMKSGFEEMRRGFDAIDNRLAGIDTSLRSVETDVAELKGRRLAIKEWIPIGIAAVAVIVSVIALRCDFVMKSQAS